MMHRRFTLVEVLVTVMIIAVVVPVTLRALSLNARLDSIAIQRQQAARLAEQKLRELVVTGDWLAAERSGTFGDDYPGYAWELDAGDWSLDLVTLRQLVLTVRGSGGDRSAVTLTVLTPYSEVQ